MFDLNRFEGRVLAVASGGGHWLEMCRLYPVFENSDVAFVSVKQAYAEQVPNHRFVLEEVGHSESDHLCQHQQDRIPHVWRHQTLRRHDSDKTLSSCGDVSIGIRSDTAT
jgi:hypothetical protein